MRLAITILALVASVIAAPVAAPAAAPEAAPVAEAEPQSKYGSYGTLLAPMSPPSSTFGIQTNESYGRLQGSRSPSWWIRHLRQVSRTCWRIRIVRKVQQGVDVV
jgi:hypothetical protein